MGGASSYWAMLSICAFLSATWGASKVSRLAGVSSIVLEIATGVILGPGVIKLLNPEYSVCEHSRNTKCQAPPDLSFRIANLQPLGEDLGRIANMDLCHAEDYEDHHGGGHGNGHGNGGAHGGSQHGGGHIMQHSDPDDDGGNGTGINHAAGGGHGLDGGPAAGAENATGVGHAAGDEHATGDGHAAGDEHGDGHANGDEQEHGHDGGSGHGNGDHAVEGDEAHGSSDEHGEGHSNGGHGAGHHRRLSGGSYHSYEECLVKSCESEIAHDCQLTPDVFTLIGHAGVALMIFESGMHFDFEQARVVGGPACCVAVFGTILPLITGTILTMIYGKPFFPHGISVGTALAPTSVGIALRLLGEAGVLQQNFGQAIITAAFVDDILSLVLFNVLFSLGGEFNAVTTIVFPIVGIIFMLLAMAAAVKVAPTIIDRIILPSAPEVREGDRRGCARIRLTQDEILFVLMFVVLVVYATITHLLGTHLWGCFIAGMTFACLQPPHHAQHVWVKQTKRMTSWMIRIFFACTVGFSIPVDKLLSFNAFWKGIIMGFGPCILTKVCCAPFMGATRWVIGWAMVGRAEFAYLIAQMAVSANMMDQETFSIVIWALLCATIFAPFIFRYLLNRYVAKTFGDRASLKDHQGEEGRIEQDAYCEGETTYEEPSEGKKPAFASNVVGGPAREMNGIVKDEETGGHAPWAPPLESGVVARRRGGGEEAVDTVTKSATGKNGTNSGLMCCHFLKKVVG